MNVILRFILKHGYAFLFAALFAHQIGFPLPGPLFLLAAGALVATGKLNFLAVIAITAVACVLADLVWFEAGRRQGDKVLHFMHRLTRDPDFHDRRAKRVFARYGPRLLLVSKFIPGLDAVAPPMAGTSRTSRLRFILFDGVGASLYACVYGGLGFAFSHNLDRAARYVSRVGEVLVWLVVGAACIYISVRLLQRYRNFQCMPLAPAEPVQSADPTGIIGEQKSGE